MKRQISDSIPCGILLALSGGCMDAYSYLFRGHVFANAQTGNMLLLGVNLADGDMHAAAKYFWPVLAFIVGIILSDFINAKWPLIKVHWRQISVLVEVVILTCVSFMSEDMNQLANILTSFACGIQVESFRQIHGNTVATTMCIGNLRSGTYNIDQFISTRKKEYLTRGLLYFGIILSFMAGAILESRLIIVIGGKALLLSTTLLVIAMLIMFRTPNGDDGDTYIEG